MHQGCQLLLAEGESERCRRGVVACHTPGRAANLPETRLCGSRGCWLALGCRQDGSRLRVGPTAGSAAQSLNRGSCISRGGGVRSTMRSMICLDASIPTLPSRMPGPAKPHLNEAPFSVPCILVIGRSWVRIRPRAQKLQVRDVSGVAGCAAAPDGHSLGGSSRRRRSRELRGEEADLLCPLDCLAARAGPDLAVDGDGLGLDRVVREVQPLADLAKGEVGRQEGQQAQLGGGE